MTSRLSPRAASATSASSCTSLQRIPSWRSFHGRRRPVPPSASSTNPYLASWRRWNEAFAGLSPTRSPASVAVSCPASVSASSSASRTGCASARIALGSVSSRGGSKGMFRKVSCYPSEIKSKEIFPSSIVAIPIVCSGCRRRSVGEPGLKI